MRNSNYLQLFTDDGNIFVQVIQHWFAWASLFRMEKGVYILQKVNELFGWCQSVQHLDTKVRMWKFLSAKPQEAVIIVEVHQTSSLQTQKHCLYTIGIIKWGSLWRVCYLLKFLIIMFIDRSNMNINANFFQAGCDI